MLNKNKLKYIILLLLYVTSCSNKVGNKVIEINYSEKSIFPKELIGEWSICQIGAIVFSICTRIKFENDKSGEIILPTKKVYPFKWDVQQNKIIINFFQRNNFFGKEAKFDTSISNTDEKILMIMISKERKYRYFLRRHKK